MERLPHWKVMERYEPELLEKLEPWREQMFEGGVLTRREKELVIMAMAAQARFLPGVVIHAERALDHGATAKELVEVCALSLLIGGVPSYRESVLAVDEMLREREEANAEEGS